MKKLIAVAAIAAVACGCISVHKNDGGNSDLRPEIVKAKVVEKMTVGAQPVTAEEEIQCVLGLICWGATATHVADQAEFSGFGPVAKAKNGAYAKACEAAGCDQLVGTRYTITMEDYVVYKKCKVVVTGYPVTLQGVEVLPPCPGPVLPPPVQ